MILLAEKITKSFSSSGERFYVFQDLSINIESKELVTIVGPSGSGKSTLLNILGTLDKYDEGSLYLNGIDISKMDSNQMAKARNELIGFVFQFHHLIPELSALENVLLPQLILSGSDNPSRAKELLSFLGLSKRMHHFPSQLSGGERSRVSIARALINRPKIILADEPSGNLDHVNAKKLIKLFKSINDEFDQSIIIATHDPDVASIGRRKLLLDNKVLSSVDSI